MEITVASFTFKLSREAFLGHSSSTGRVKRTECRVTPRHAAKSELHREISGNCPDNEPDS
jgi:hypothetical protein